MNFTYQILRQAEASGDRIGNWKGMPVFACRSNNLKHKGSGAYFILYDDENKIVGMFQDDWYEYGTVSSTGNVSELDRRRLYGESKPKPKSTPKKEVPQTYTAEPQKEEAAAVVADVKIGIDVDATLKAARTQTIADLLAGFKYGLDN